MKATLAKQWGPHPAGAIVTTDTPEAGEIPINNARWTFLEEGKYFVPAKPAVLAIHHQAQPAPPPADRAPKNEEPAKEDEPHGA